MKKVEMHVPNKSYNGYYGGVAFHKGVGVFTDIEKAKDLANRYGFTIVDTDIDVDTNVDTNVDVEVEVKPVAKKRTRKAKAGE